MARGKWYLSKEELDWWIAYAIIKTEQFTSGEIKIVDLSSQDVTPIQVDQIMEAIGWHLDRTEPGIEMDYYHYYTKEGRDDMMVVYVSALTFELAVYYARDMYDIDFKDEHRAKMAEDLLENGRE